MSICPVVLAGGSGSRLWPLSQQHYPKQFINMFGKHSMLQQTLMRLEGIDQNIQILPTQIVCNESHRFVVVDEANKINHDLQEIILEPIGRNTAPALTIAALWQLQSDHDPVLLMMPADHLIKDVKAFQESIKLAYEEAMNGVIVTFGITPSSPESGYGYIRSEGESDIKPILGFTEKPGKEVAEGFLKSGNYFWNSGLFILKASVWLDAIRQVNPTMVECCERAIQEGQNDDKFFWLDQESFDSCPNDSIDYAVMENIGRENSPNAVVINLDAGWSDIGSWLSVWEHSGKDKDGNVIEGDVLQRLSTNNLIRGNNKLVTTIGVEDLIIVDTSDALMIAHKDCSQEVKGLVENLKENERKEYESHQLVLRPWGSYETLEMRDGFQVKRIVVNPGKRLSLQLHHKRSEHWVVVNGTGTVTLGDDEFELNENESTFIPVETKHRLENKTSQPLTMIEVQVGSYLGEDDIVRFDDDFGRA